MYASIVPVLCYPAASCWLLEEKRAMSGLAESMWHLLKDCSELTLCCISFPGHLLLVSERGLC